MNSRGAATECSPGREPGVFFRHDLSPRGAIESFGVFRPFGAAFPNDTYPGLAPGATLCRRSAAEYSTGFQRKLTMIILSADVGETRVSRHRFGFLHRSENGFGDGFGGKRADG